MGCAGKVWIPSNSVCVEGRFANGHLSISRWSICVRWLRCSAEMMWVWAMCVGILAGQYDLVWPEGKGRWRHWSRHAEIRRSAYATCLATYKIHYKEDDPQESWRDLDTQAGHQSINQSIKGKYSSVWLLLCTGNTTKQCDTRWIKPMVHDDGRVEQGPSLQNSTSCTDQNCTLFLLQERQIIIRSRSSSNVYELHENI